MRLVVGPAPRHYTGPRGERSWSTWILSFLGNSLVLGAVLGTGGQASQIHSESAQTLRIHTDIALVQLPVHIAITQPCTLSIASTASQLKYYEYTAAYIKDRNCTAVHTKHSKYTVTQLASTVSMQRY